jgi:hypothetical protein
MLDIGFAVRSSGLLRLSVFGGEKILIRSIAVSILASTACISVVPMAHAAFIVIPQPVAAYTGGTTLLSLPPAGTVVNALTNGTFTLTFTSPDAGTQVIARDAVPVGWSTWNSPPAVESSTPRVLQDLVNLTCTTCTLDLAFSSPVGTFGFEAEPDPLSIPHSITATFFNGAATLGSIPVAFPNGNGTARLFAATTSGSDQFTSVRITIDGTDFAMAQLRFGQQITLPTGGIPEPGTVLLMLGGLAAIGYRKLRQS